MTFIPSSNRFRRVTVADNSNTLVLGNAGTPSSTAVWEIQFNPSLDFDGVFYLLGHVRQLATPSTQTSPSGGSVTPYLQIPYRRINMNGVPQDWAIVNDAIVGASIIQVPSNGMSIGVTVVCSRGTCDITSYDVQGSGTP